MIAAVVAALFERRPDVSPPPRRSSSPPSPAGWSARCGACLVFELGDIWPASIVGVGAMRRNLTLALMEKLELFLYRRAARVVALTQAFKANLTRRGIDPDKIAVVRNGVDLARYAPRPRDEALAAEWGLAGAFVLGYVGTHGMAHGLMNVLDAAERLRDRPDICFLLVGDGAERAQLLAGSSAVRSPTSA